VSLVFLPGSAATFLFLFFGFFKFGSRSVPVWDTDFLAFVSSVPAILALAGLVWAICELNVVNLPSEVLTFTSAQLKATWGVAAAGVMLAFATTDGDKHALFWLQLLGSFAMAAGSIMALLGKETEVIDLPGGDSDAATDSAKRAPQNRRLGVGAAGRAGSGATPPGPCRA